MNRHTVELDTFVARRSALAALDFELVPESPPHGFPLVAVCMFGTAIALFVFWFHGEQTQDVVKILAFALLGLSIVYFVYHRAMTKGETGAMMQKFSPCLDELKQLRKEVQAYLKQLDERTSRYFHAVTNTKVRDYFMLRQLDESIGELTDEIERLMHTSTARNYRKIYQLLRGTIVFRDGLERNMGQQHEVHVVHITPHVQALAHQLEAGVSELEADIERFNRLAKRGEPFPELSEIQEQADYMNNDNLLDPKR